MRDPVNRRAARLAALVALPIALVAGVLAYRLLSRDATAPDGTTAAASGRPQSTAAVDVATQPLAAGDAATCRALFTKLPDHLGDLRRRPVSAGPDQNAAYGDPPLLVACGAHGPAAPPDAQYFQINGVCWYAQPVDSGGAAWSLVGRAVPLVVTMPAGYTGQDLVDLAGPITATVRLTTDECT